VVSKYSRSFPPLSSSLAEGDRQMIRVCYYKGCGVIFGEKEPLSDKRITHGLCPKHLELTLKEIKDEIEKLMVLPGGLKVLIVEDSTLFRQLLKKTLHDRFLSIEIYEAADGEEALKKIESLRPNLIFMDIGLPGENGLELTRKVKGRYPNIIVIILTGYDLGEYRESSSRNADYVLLKDLSTIENIPTLVESILLNRL